jgi:hypothetical protein
LANLFQRSIVVRIRNEKSASATRNPHPQRLVRIRNEKSAFSMRMRISHFFFATAFQVTSILPHLATMPELRPGKGAKASVLTRMINPKQHLPNNDKQHRSEVILEGRMENEKGVEVYSFRHVEDDSDGLLLHASTRYVKIVEEGERELFFDDEGEGEEGKIKWKDSEARQILYKDVKERVIPLEAKYNDGTPTMTLEEIYASRPEFAAYDYNKFSSRLATIRNTIKQLEERTDADEAAFATFADNHPVSHYDRKGHIHWPGSRSQELAKADIEAGLLQQGYKPLYGSRPEYFMEFDFETFSDKVRQEIKTKKYLHTLKVRGKQHKAS